MYRTVIIIIFLIAGIACSVGNDEVARTPLEADFMASPVQVKVSQPVQFTLISSGSIKSCYWDFGDGESSYELSPVHSYRKEGRYTVILVVNGSSEMAVEKKIDYISVVGDEKPAVSSEVISWLDAGKYIGQQKTVEGIIVDTYYGANIKGQPTFLNFYKPYKDFFKCLIWGSERAKFISVFPPNPETFLINKTVQVIGLIEEYPERSGIPEIILKDPLQLKIIMGR